MCELRSVPRCSHARVGIGANSVCSRCLRPASRPPRRGLPRSGLHQARLRCCTLPGWRWHRPTGSADRNSWPKMPSGDVSSEEGRAPCSRPALDRFGSWTQRWIASRLPCRPPPCPVCCRSKVLGVEPHFCASLTSALKAGKPVKAETMSTLADGLAVPTVGCAAGLRSVVLIFSPPSPLSLLFCGLWDRPRESPPAVVVDRPHVRYRRASVLRATSRGLGRPVTQVVSSSWPLVWLSIERDLASVPQPRASSAGGGGYGLGDEVMSPLAA